MYRFYDSHLEPIFDVVGARSIVEIGAGDGPNTRRLIDYAARTGARLDVVDPYPVEDLRSQEPELREVGELHVELSLDVLDRLDGDVFLIDGDHNWYTVLSELELIDQRVRRSGGRFPVVCFHDVGWPNGERDSYFDPELIPEEARQPNAQRGVLPGRDDLIEVGGLNYDYHNALHEGGPRNGVRCAIRDFMGSCDRELTFHLNPAYHGLGVLYCESELGEEVSRKLLPIVTLSTGARAMIEQLEAQRVAYLIWTPLPPLRRRIGPALRRRLGNAWRSLGERFSGGKTSSRRLPGVHEEPSATKVAVS